MDSCIYKRGEDKCASPVKPNCLYFKNEKCAYNPEGKDTIVSYLLRSHRIRSERRMEDYK